MPKAAILSSCVETAQTWNCENLSGSSRKKSAIVYLPTASLWASSAAKDFVTVSRVMPRLNLRSAAAAPIQNEAHRKNCPCIMKSEKNMARFGGPCFLVAFS
jgi:hypothetical protein